MSRRVVATLVVALACVAFGAATAEARMGRHGPRPRIEGPRMELTDDQREGIRALVDELRATDATRSEIREAIHEALEEWGVDLPDEPAIRRGPRGRGFGFFHFDLTEDQRTEIRETVAALRAADADRESIRAAVHDLLVEWGIIEPDDVEDGDAAADLAVIDGEIQAAPSLSQDVSPTSWAALKTER